MIAAAESSELVKIVEMLFAFLTLLANGYIIYKHGQLRSEQAKLAAHVNGHMTDLLAQTADAARSRGNREGAAEKTEEIRVERMTDALAKPIDVVPPTKTVNVQSNE